MVTSRLTRRLNWRQTRIIGARAGRPDARTVQKWEGKLRAILLDARGAQTGQAMLIDRILPGKKFFDGQGIATAGFFQGKQSAAHSSNYFRLAANDPALGPRCGQI